VPRPPAVRCLRYLIAADLVETLYRGLADNYVGKLIDSLLRSDLIVVDELVLAPLDAVSSQSDLNPFPRRASDSDPQPCA
jgi:hypothetical protein